MRSLACSDCHAEPRLQSGGKREVPVLALCTDCFMIGGLAVQIILHLFRIGVDR